MITFHYFEWISLITQMLLRNFLLWRGHQLAFLWMRDIISQDCNRSETQIFTQWTKIGFCWYSDQIRPRDHPKIAWDLRSRGDFVQQLFVPALPVSCLDLASLLWFSCDPYVWTLDHSLYLIWSGFCYRALLLRARSHSWLMENIYLFIIQISPSQAICPRYLHQYRDHRKSQQRDNSYSCSRYFLQFF